MLAASLHFEVDLQEGTTSTIVLAHIRARGLWRVIRWTLACFWIAESHLVDRLLDCCAITALAPRPVVVAGTLAVLIGGATTVAVDAKHGATKQETTENRIVAVSGRVFVDAPTFTPWAVEAAAIAVCGVVRFPARVGCPTRVGRSTCVGRTTTIVFPSATA